MHHIQQGILDLADSKNLRQMSLREIGRTVTGKEESAQKIKYHLDTLFQGGFLRVDEARDAVVPVKRGETQSGFVSIPVLGTASCGPATQLAEGGSALSYLCLSERFLPRNLEGVFAVRAVGTSMNRAKVNGGKSIEDGDFVIVDSKDRQPTSGAYVLAVAGGMANVKKFVKDDIAGQIMLVSESSQDLSPIYVHPEDQTDFFINGRVVDVMKSPR